jgi:hypothetical protein
MIGIRVKIGAGNFSPHHRVQNGSGAHPSSYPMGTSGSFLEVKRPGREADHSPPSRHEIKNARSYKSPPPTRLHGVKHRDNLTFTFLFSSLSGCIIIFYLITWLISFSVKDIF